MVVGVSITRYFAVLFILTGIWIPGCAPGWIHQPRTDIDYPNTQYITQIGIVQIEEKNKLPLSDARDLAGRKAQEKLLASITRIGEEQKVFLKIDVAVCRETSVEKFHEDQLPEGGVVVYALGVFDKQKCVNSLGRKSLELSKKASDLIKQAEDIQRKDPLSALHHYFRAHETFESYLFVVKELSRWDEGSKKPHTIDGKSLEQLESHIIQFAKSFQLEIISPDHTRVSIAKSFATRNLKVRAFSKRFDREKSLSRQMAIKDIPIHFEILSDNIKAFSSTKSSTNDQGYLDTKVQYTIDANDDLSVGINLLPDLSQYQKTSTRSLANNIRKVLSNKRVVFTFPPTVLPPPTNIKVEFQGSEDQSPIHVTWDPVNTRAVSGYAICRETYDLSDVSVERESLLENCQIGETTDKTFVDTEAKEGKSYRYAIATRNKKGEVGALSAPTALLVMPPKVTSPQAKLDQTPAGIEITWRPATGSGVVEYEVYRREKNENVEIRIGIHAASDLPLLYRDKDELVPGKTYEYRIQARNIQNRISSRSIPSNPVVFHVQPAPIKGLGGVLRGKQILLEWEGDQSADFSHYEVSVEQLNNNPLGRKDSFITRDHRWNSEDISPDSRLKYTVCAINTIKWETCDAVVVYSYPHPPRNLVAHVRPGGGMELNWGNPNKAPIKEFLIYRNVQTKETSFSLLKKIRVDDISYEAHNPFQFTDLDEFIGLTSYYIVAIGMEGTQSVASNVVVVNRADLTLKSAVQKMAPVCQVGTPDPLKLVLTYLQMHEILSASMPSSVTPSQKETGSKKAHLDNLCRFIQNTTMPALRNIPYNQSAQQNLLSQLRDLHARLERETVRLVKSFQIAPQSRMMPVQVELDKHTQQLKDTIKQPFQVRVTANSGAITPGGKNAIAVSELPVNFYVHGIADSISYASWAQTDEEGKAYATFRLPLHLKGVSIEAQMQPNLGTFMQPLTQQHVEKIQALFRKKNVSSLVPIPLLPPPPSVAVSVSEAYSEPLIQIAWKRWNSLLVKDYLVVKKEIDPQERIKGFLARSNCQEADSYLVPHYFYTSLRDPQVKNGQSFLYCVATRNHKGHLGAFKKLIIHMPPLVSESPKLNLLEREGPVGIEVSWDSAIGQEIVEYEIQRRWRGKIQKIKTIGAKNTPFGFIDENQNDDVPTNFLVPGETYEYAIRAKNAHGRWSAISTPRKIDYHVRPYSVGTPAVDVLGKNFVLRWKRRQPPDFGYFTVSREQVARDNEGPCTTDRDIEKVAKLVKKVQVPDWIDWAPPPDSRIRYKVCAVNEILQNWQTCECSKRIVTSPKPPINVKAELINGITRIRWEDPNRNIGRVKYKVFRRFGLLGKFRKQKLVESLVYEDRHGPRGTSPVFYRLIAVSKNGLESQGVECRVMSGKVGHCKYLPSLMGP